VDFLVQRFGQNRLLCAIQVFETIDTRSLAELTRRFDWSRLQGYNLNAPGEITISTILQAPGVMRFPEEAVKAEEAWPAVERALRAALADLIKMREREGKHLTVRQDRQLAACVDQPGDSTNTGLV